MTDSEVQVDVHVTSNSPLFAGLQEDMSGESRPDSPESPQSTGKGEVEEASSMLAAVALATPGGNPEACSVKVSIQVLELELEFLMSKADVLHDCLVNGQGNLDREALAAEVPSFLFICEPFFNRLESQRQTHLLSDFYTRLLDFTQQLCDRLEQLVLTYASYNLLSLDETKPDSVSHFCIGRSRVGPLRVTTFRYCKPTPYLAQVDTGLYKRMRWNVERLGDKQQTDRESEEGMVGDTEYFFLCYEDIPNQHAEAGGQSQVMRMWSIGQWVQTTPVTDDIYEWITCEVPEAEYHRLLFLGSQEPSSCCATEYLQQLLDNNAHMTSISGIRDDQ